MLSEVSWLRSEIFLLLLLISLALEFLVEVERLVDDFVSLFLTLEFFQHYLDSLSTFVVFEEMFDLHYRVHRYLSDIVDVSELGIAVRDCDDLVILFIAVDHLNHTDDSCFDEGERWDIFTAEHEDIKRILVASHCGRDVSVERRIMNRIVQYSI